MGCRLHRCIQSYTYLPMPLKRMFTPGLADLFEALVVSGAATHSVKVLRNKRMIVVRQSKPIHVDRPFVTRISSQSEADAAIRQNHCPIAPSQSGRHDDIGAGNGPNAGLVQCRQ